MSKTDASNYASRDFLIKKEFLISQEKFICHKEEDIGLISDLLKNNYVMIILFINPFRLYELFLDNFIIFQIIKKCLCQIFNQP